MPESSPTTNLARLQRLASFARWGTLLLLLTMFLGTHLPIGKETFIMVSPGDKTLHVLSYMVLAVSTLVSWELTVGLLQPLHYFTVWLLGTLYGAFDEVTQIPCGRSCDGLDWLSDIVGIVLGLIVFRVTRPLLYHFVSKVA